MHVFVDLSDWPGDTEALGDFVGRLTRADGIAALGSRATCVLPAAAGNAGSVPAGWHLVSGPPADEARAAIRRAARAGEPLAVVLGAVDPSPDTLAALADGLSADPLFGAAHPRFTHETGGDVLAVLAADAGHPPLPRPVLSRLPGHHLLPEYLSRCFVVRREVVANIEPAAHGPASTAAFFLAYLRQARRTGYRCVVDNRVVVAMPAYATQRAGEIEAVPAGTDAAHDTRRAAERFRRTTDLRREPLIGAVADRPRRVLIDARNLGTAINGTTKVLLLLADALHALDTGWSFTVVAPERAATALDLGARYPRWTVATRLPHGPFAAAFRPSQPWAREELLSLHEVAAANVFLMLDTIAWDIVYTAPPTLDATWRFAARFADGLLFISDFSRQRFAARFPLHPEVETGVCHLSLDPQEYVDPNVGRADPDSPPYWLIVGNAYDHKHVEPTLGLLMRAFPTMRFAVLGGSDMRSARLTLVTSGQRAEAEVQQMYAHADTVIFPSLYEGFGLPVVNALAYGRTVVARDSALLREIAEGYLGPGRLVPFTSADGLVDTLSRLRHRRDVPSVPLASDGTPHGWADAAGVVVSFLETLLSSDLPRMTDRQHALSALDAGLAAGA